MRASGLVLVLALLAGCGSLPVPGRLSTRLIPSSVSAHLPASTAETVLAELGRAVATRYNLSGGPADTLTLIDVLPADSQTLRVQVRIVQAGKTITSFAAVLPLARRETWAWTLLQQLEHARGPARAWYEVTDEDQALDQALREADYVEAERLAYLIADKTGQTSLPAAIAAEALRARTEAEVRALLALLNAPEGSPRSETLLLPEVLDRVRQEAWSDAGLNPAVVQAFRARFGRDLAAQLDRPSLVYVEGGTFSMGSEDEADERPLHAAAVPGFLMGRTEVTQAQYQAVTGNNPSLFTVPNDAARRPVERVSWYEAVEFCNKLSAAEGLEAVYTVKGTEVTQDRSRNGYRLPTEAEWEWAARGGVRDVQTPLAGGGDPSLVAWTDGTTGPYPVAEKAPNELGLYDLSGNVWEWCWDWYSRYDFGPVSDPEGPASGILKVGRGGSWRAAAWNARVSTRSFDNPGSRSSNLGFRVVRSVTLP